MTTTTTTATTGTAGALLGEPAGIWLRVSSGGQDEANQLPDIMRHVQSHGYRVERRFAPPEKASWDETLKQGNGPATPNRYGERRGPSPCSMPSLNSTPNSSSSRHTTWQRRPVLPPPSKTRTNSSGTLTFATRRAPPSEISATRQSPTALPVAERMLARSLVT